jgi:hypothetical protein
MTPGARRVTPRVHGGADLRSFADAAFDVVGAAPGAGVPGMHHLWEVGGTAWAFCGSSPAFGRILERGFGPGLRHVPDVPGADLFTIHCVDGGGLRERLRPPPVRALAVTAPDPSRRLWQAPGIRVVHQLREDILTVLDLRNRRALVQVPDPAGLPYYEQAAPMRGLLHGLMASVHRSLIHGAVIGTAAGGVLLAGPSGSGKSTTALAGLVAGMHFAGDDYVLVDNCEYPRAYGLYASVKVARKDLARCAGLDAELANPAGPPEEKGVFFLDREPPGFRSGLQLRAIVLPRITRDAMHVRPCAPARALRELAPATLFQIVGDREPLFEHCTRLVRQLPAFMLDTGPRTDHFERDVARTISGLLDGIAGA